MRNYDNQKNLDPLFFASMLATYPVGYMRDQELYGLFADPGGNLGDAKWFEGRVLQAHVESAKNRVRYWDLAATEKKIAGKKITDPDETVGTLLSHFLDENLPKQYQNQFC
ncbi:MAG: hypothetical protein KJ744_02425, partial [Bacteroidetes bacterium]|nr:hypothetical protein [Bacteroidota bacterium]